MAKTPYAFSVRDSLTFGWNTFKQRPGFFIATFLVYIGIQFIVAGIQKAAPGPASFLLSTMVSILLYAGIVRIYLTAFDNPSAAHFAQLWNPEPFLKYLGVSVVLFLIVLVGLIFLIVPGVILGLMFSLAGFLVIDRNLAPIDALKESYRITKGNLWPLFLFWCSIVVLSILGMIPFGLGLLVIAPVAMLANIYIYRTITGSDITIVPGTTTGLPIAERS